MTRLWEAWRHGVHRICGGIGVLHDVLTLHRDWVGDLAGQRVLDLGSHTGYQLSFELGRKSNFRFGVALGGSALATPRDRMEVADIRIAEVRAHQTALRESRHLDSRPWRRMSASLSRVRKS